MAEYIEREALVKAISEMEVAGVFTAAFKNSILEIISEQLAANVAEVRHGKWMKVSNGVAYWHVCSECMKSIPKEEYGNDYFSNYCPNCGAKMD